jgi:uncharacterized protein YjbI with pentapeptide repeats
MNATKMIALLLGVASLGLFILFAFVAFAGPTVLGGAVPAPWPLDKLSSGCLGLVMFCVSAPLSAMPGLAGLSLWLFVIRKQDAATDWEVLAGPEREAAFQSRLDGLTRRLLEHGGDPAALAPEIPIWIRDLDGAQRNRVLRLLAECGGDDGPGPSTRFIPSPDGALRPPGWWTRAFSLGLLGFAAFCLLWGAFVVFSSLTTHLGQVVLPGSTPVQAATGSGGCFVIGLTALLAGLAVHWLARREARGAQRRTASRQRISKVALESCLRQLESLLKEPDANASPAEAAAVRIARARVVCTMPELDGADKGRLIVQLHAGRLLPRLALSGADLRGALLAGTDLSAAALAGVDLSGANLSRARLVRADLGASRLQGADLRGADAGGANLRHADLRQARMHRCNLSQADLRGANVDGANLWQADLTGAQMDRDLAAVADSRSGQRPSKELRRARR